MFLCVSQNSRHIPSSGGVLYPWNGKPSLRMSAHLVSFMSIDLQDESHSSVARFCWEEERTECHN